MVTLVIGGSGSGKSAYAENLLEGLRDVKHKYYLATMRVSDEESRRKVLQHRRQRMQKGFRTVEQPQEIGRAAAFLDFTEPGGNAVLLECISNLAANEMFGPPPGPAGEAANEMFGTPPGPAGETAKKVLDGVRQLERAVRHLIIVTNNVFEDGIRHERGTEEYLQALAQINQQLAREADAVVEVVAGRAIVLKSGREENGQSIPGTE